MQGRGQVWSRRCRERKGGARPRSALPGAGLGGTAPTTRRSRRLPPLPEEPQPPRQEHASLRLLRPRVPLAVPRELGERARAPAGRGGAEGGLGRAGLSWRSCLPPAPLQVRRWTEQIKDGTFAGKL